MPAKKKAGKAARAKPQKRSSKAPDVDAGVKVG